MNDKQLTPEEYEPYGPEWEQEMSKFPKLQLIKRLARAYQGVRDRDALQSWKNEAMQILKNLDLQEIGKMIGAKLGTDVSTQVRPAIAALQARVQELETEIRGLYAEEIDDSYEVATLKSRIAELVRENENLSNEADRLSRELFWKKQHAEKLMGLLERMVKKHFWFDAANPEKTPEQIWQSYRTEHGLQSPENPAP